MTLRPVALVPLFFMAYATKLGGGWVRSLLHVPGEKRFFAGLDNGELVTVDLGSGEVSSRVQLGGGFAIIRVIIAIGTTAADGGDRGEGEKKADDSGGKPAHMAES